MKKVSKLQNQMRLSNEVISKALSTQTNALENDQKYSLSVDPENIYGMSFQQKEFIHYYIEFRSLPIAAELAKIDIEQAKTYYVAYSSQQEIRRINSALYQRQFTKKMLSIEEIVGYLSSLITDEYVPSTDRLKSMEKVQVAKMLIDLNIDKNAILNDPSLIMNVDVEKELKSLTVDTLKNLLNQSKTNNDKMDKEKVIDKLNVRNEFLPEELSYLRTLSMSELLELLSTNEKQLTKKMTKP